MGSRRWNSVKANYSSLTTADVAAFCAWSLDVHNTLLSIGLIDEPTSWEVRWDFSQQYVPAANVYPFFRIYELNDSLSGTLPIFIKIFFGGTQQQTGTHAGKAHQPHCKIQIGTTVTAGGVLGGLVTEEFVVCGGPGTGTGGTFSTTSSPNYFHKSNIGLFLFLGGSPGLNNGGLYGTPAMMFYLERLPDANGNPTADGYSIVRPQQASAFDHGTVNGPPSLAAIARTYTAAFDLGSWHTDMTGPLGGSVTATVEGGINFQPFYHVCPELRPMRGIFGYYGGTMANYSITDLQVAGGADIQVIALGGTPAQTKSPYGMLVDRFDSNFLLAVVKD